MFILALLLAMMLLAAGPVAAQASGDGLQRTCWDNIDFTGPSVTRVDAVVDFSWGVGSCDPSIGADTFSARWTGNIQPTTSGSHTFYTYSDDGVRLWVNGVLVINNYTDHSPIENSGTITLNAGVHYDIRIDYYENAGGSDIRLSWLPPGGLKAVVPQSQLSSTQQGGGVPATYFDTIDFTGPTLARTDANIDFDWSTGSPDPTIGADTFSVRWTGSLRAPSTGTYTFHTTSDDGVRLWVDGTLLVDNWTVHSATDDSATIALSASQHYEFKLEYFENDGLATARLGWTPPGGTREIIPAPNLSPRSPPSAPTALGQFRSDGTTAIPGAAWSDSTVVLRFDVSDRDARQTLTPWVEVRSTNSFTGTCGTGGVGMYSGPPVSAAVGGTPVSASVTVTGLAEGSTWYWRACAVDQNPLIGPFTPRNGTPDFGVDTTAPSNPAQADIFDLSTSFGPDVDTTTSTTALSASWNAASDAGSGVASYEVCFSTIDIGCTNIPGTTTQTGNTSRTATATATGMAVGSTYFTCIRAIDAVGNIPSWRCSDGFTVVVAVTSTNPGSQPKGLQGATVQVLGANFAAGASVAFSGGDVTVVSTTFVSATRIDVTLNIGTSGVAGTRDVTVTNPDLTSGTGSGVFAVTEPSITLSLSTLGHASGARTNSPPYTIGFGSLPPGTSRRVGPTAAATGQAIDGAAVIATITSDTTTSLRVSATDFTGPGALPAASLAWRRTATSDPWSSMPTADAAIEGPLVPGTTVVSHDLKLDVPITQLAGSYSTTITYTAAPSL